jgi:hypothetical protein
MRSFINCTLHQYNWNYEVKEGEMGSAFSTHEGEHVYRERTARKS